MSTNVTMRYMEPVTLRFPEVRPSQSDPVTRRFIATVDTPATSYAVGQLLVGRYRILKTSLGNISGEAELYQCQDELYHTQVAFKLYHPHKQPKLAVLEKLHSLVHPYLLRILEHGEWHGRYFEVMPYCGGGNLSERLPLNEIALQLLLPQLLEAMRFCHDHSIIHRDIKPSNILFADNNDVQLADFGISSYLATVDGVTRTAGNLTLDYAAPELIEGHQIGPATDYYALGITLIHALIGRSPFAGLSQNDIIIAHLRGRRSIPKHITPSWRQLLFGLTLNDTKNRWGYTQVQDWLTGYEVPVVPDQFADTQGHKIPSYPGWPVAHTPEQLGLDLAHFDAINQLLNDDIRRWLFDNFGHGLAAKVDTIKHTYGTRPATALHYLGFTLAPKSPLIIARQEITSLDALFELIAESFHNPDSKTALLKALEEEQIRAWLLITKPAAEHSEELAKQIEAIQHRQFGYKSTILFALYYVLDPTRPLMLTPHIAIQQPHEIGPAFLRNASEVFQAWAELIKTHRLDEWLRAINWQPLDKTLDFLNDIRYRFLEHPHTQTYAVLWWFAPDLPFFLTGRGFNRPEELADTIDNRPALKDKFIKSLENGLLLAWLMGSGRLEDTGPLRQLLMNADISWSIRVEQVLQLLNPQRIGPMLQTDKAHINLGILKTDANPLSTDLTLINSGGGYLFGDIGWGKQLTGIELSSYKFESNQVSIVLTLKIPDWDTGTHRYQLHIKSNGGNLTVPVSYYVPENKAKPDWRYQLAQWVAPLGKINRWIIIGGGLVFWIVANALMNYMQLREFRTRFQQLSDVLVPVDTNYTNAACLIDHKQKQLWTISAKSYSANNASKGVDEFNNSTVCQHHDWRQPTKIEMQQLQDFYMKYQVNEKMATADCYWGAENNYAQYSVSNGRWNYFPYGGGLGACNLILTTLE